MNLKSNFRMAAAVLASVLMASCSNGGGFSRHEKSLIKNSDSLMRVLTIEDRKDSLVLRSKCTELDPKTIGSETYATLEQLMKNTVVAADGVGIAGPQVGIKKRVIAVQRFDKPDAPFIVYPNVRIIATNGEKEAGPEGCLSIPGHRGNVMRWQDIEIQYTSPVTLKDTIEEVMGYSAVIFQHECDHLDGVLYTDKLCDK